MTIFRASLLVLLTLLLVGCATTDTKNDLAYGPKCIPLNHSLKSIPTAITTTDIKIATLDKSDFYELTPTRVFNGIKSLNLHDTKLTLSLVDKAYFEQYSAPVINLVRESQYEAHPIRAFFGTIFTAGVIWVIAPKPYSDFASGCTDKSLISSNPDTTKKIKTGKTEWRETEKAHKFLVSGFDKNYMFDIYMSTYERLPASNQVVINLGAAIINTDLTNSTTIKITCLDCDLLGQEEQALYKDAKKTVEITADFRAIKANLIVETAKKKVEQVRRDKEDLQRRKESQGVPLNEFKAQCQALGFKLGSKEYGNCVLELNDSK